MDGNSRMSKSRHSFDSALVFRNVAGMSWRHNSLANIANDLLRRNDRVLDTVPVETPQRSNKSTETSLPVETNQNEKPKAESLKRDKTVRSTIVDIVIVEAKGLPHSPEDGCAHAVYCKLRLGSQSFKSKSVQHNRQPKWREGFKCNLPNDQLLNVSLWDKGKQKNFMGSCVIDLSSWERERTHDIWRDLDGGYGSIHLSVTMCAVKKTQELVTNEANTEDLRSKFAFYNLSPDLSVVGQLHVKVVGAKGLCGKPNAYCTLELDNEKVITPSVSAIEPVWNKSYVFNIYDVTSWLELKVCDSSITSYFNDFLGRVTIPLLRIQDGETRWYALKDNSKRKSAKGNCPRVRLEMNIYWNPVIASLKLFRPKQVKYMAKQPKFDVALVYKNVKFIRDTFDFLFSINESFKRAFEWEDWEYSTLILISWTTFWYYFHPWMTPLVLLSLFPIFLLHDTKQRTEVSAKTQNMDEMLDQCSLEDIQNSETMTDKIKGLPEMTLTITDGIEYLVSVAERLYNLATFKVPFLSFFTILLLLGSSVVCYFVHFRYFMIALGLYKFGRKRINPNRVLNNDLLDFISRIPDNKILKDWKELTVPEPSQKSTSTLASSSGT